MSRPLPCKDARQRSDDQHSSASGILVYRDRALRDEKRRGEQHHNPHGREIACDEQRGTDSWRIWLDRVDAIHGGMLQHHTE